MDYNWVNKEVTVKLSFRSTLLAYNTMLILVPNAAFSRKQFLLFKQVTYRFKMMFIIALAV